MAITSPCVHELVHNHHNHELILQVKNVTGRRLVGLRWWNEANDSGSAWRFESAPEVSAAQHGYQISVC